jgi:hypothetical protein
VHSQCLHALSTTSDSLNCVLRRHDYSKIRVHSADSSSRGERSTHPPPARNQNTESSRPSPHILQEFLLSHSGDRRRPRNGGSDWTLSTPLSSNTDHIRVKYSGGHWSEERAIARFKELSEFFDSPDFTSSAHRNITDFPWPILSQIFDLSQVQWQDVEQFFRASRKMMNNSEHLSFLQKSFRR